MSRRHLIVSLIALAGLIPAPARSAFQSIQTAEFTAGVSLVAGQALNIQAPVLPPNAFYGKNVVIPVTMATQNGGPIDTRGLSVDIAFQNLDSNGQPTGALTTIPIAFRLTPGRLDQLEGSAIISRDELLTIRQGGTFNYFFRATQGGGDLVLSNGGVSRVPAGSGLNIGTQNPFKVGILNQMQASVDSAGSSVQVEDTFIGDGRTAVRFPAGALTNPGSLVIQQIDPNTVSNGPRGATPAVVYNFNLQGTQLQGDALLTLSYPSDITGRVLGLNARGQDLAPYWFDGIEWRIIGRPHVDTTLHTVTARTRQLSTFALFATGAPVAADLRPRERIITPNGDGINDTATFTGLAVSEKVKIFDIRGRRVREIPGPSASWDGRDSDGDVVESGVYLFQYESQGERVSGVIAVAK